MTDGMFDDRYSSTTVARPSQNFDPESLHRPVSILQATSIHPSINQLIHRIFNEKLTKRNSVQYEGKTILCKLIHVFKELSTCDCCYAINNNRELLLKRGL